MRLCVREMLIGYLSPGGSNQHPQCGFGLGERLYCSGDRSSINWLFYYTNRPTSVEHNFQYRNDIPTDRPVRFPQQGAHNANYRLPIDRHNGIELTNDSRQRANRQANRHTIIVRGR